MINQSTAKTGLDALLTPQNSVLLLMDHQPFQFAALNSHEPTMIVNNVVGLAKTAKAFGVPTILTTVVEERGGYIIKGLQDVFPEQKPINRTLINTWQDERVVAKVKETGRQKVIMAGLWTEICVAMPALHALGDGFDVFVVTDACGGVSAEAHDMAIRRMAAAGVVPITWQVTYGRMAARLGAGRHGPRPCDGHGRERGRDRRRFYVGNAASRRPEGCPPRSCRLAGCKETSVASPSDL
jgi:nicotinamidase-related amidase